MIRVPGQGLQIQSRPKTTAGWRVLALSPAAVATLRRRQENATIGSSGVVFPSPAGKLRDPSNTADDLHRVLDPLGFDWVTSHTFRKTVATTLDDAGLSARQIADQLGHARPSLTQDVYMGRKRSPPKQRPTCSEPSPGTTTGQQTWAHDHCRR